MPANMDTSGQASSTSPFRHHYMKDNTQSDIAKEAYEEARACIISELQCSKDVEAVLQGPMNSIDSILALVENTKTRYQGTHEKKKVLKWLRRLSTRVCYYGQVLDVLAQHHPEYVALAWGTLKFVLTAFLNYDRLMQEFSKAITRIGDALSQVDLAAKLYKTDDMRDAVAQLYAHILRYFLKALKWYDKSRVGRIFGAILQPYEIGYEDTVEQIKYCVANIQNLANSKSQAEIRDLTVGFMCLRDNYSRLSHQTQEILEIVTCHKTISERIDINIEDMLPRTRDIQLSHILASLQPETSPQDALQKLQSIVKRSRSRRLPETPQRDIIQDINRWSTKNGSSLFILRVGPRAETKARELATDLVEYLQAQSINVIWQLSSTQEMTTTDPPSFEAVLKTFIHQILKLHPSLLQPQDLSIAKFQSVHAPSEWATFLKRLLAQFSQCYIILEAHDLFQARDWSAVPNWIPDILKLFQDLAVQADSQGHRLKFLVLCYGRQGEGCEEIGDMRGLLKRPNTVPVSRRHAAAHRKGVKGWMRVNSKP